MSRIALEKGGRISLSKAAPGLTKLRLGLSWDPNNFDTGAEWDLDVSVFACAVNASGQPKLVSEDYLLFYNSCFRTQDNQTVFEDLSPAKKGRAATPCLGLLSLTGDNKNGAGDGDDEAVLMDLEKLNPQVDEVSIVVTIHEAQARRQNFGQVKNSKITLYNDATGEVVATYELDENFSVETAVQFGSVYKKDGAWLFKAIGAGFKKGLGDFVNVYTG